MTHETQQDPEERERISATDAMLPRLATKSDVSDVRASIERARVNLIKWHIGTAVAVVGAVFAIVRFLG